MKSQPMAEARCQAPAIPVESRAWVPRTRTEVSEILLCGSIVLKGQENVLLTTGYIEYLAFNMKEKNKKGKTMETVKRSLVARSQG